MPVRPTLVRFGVKVTVADISYQLVTEATPAWQGFQNTEKCRYSRLAQFHARPPVCERHSDFLREWMPHRE